MNPFQYMALEMRDNKASYCYIHNGIPRISTAFEIKETAEIKLQIPRNLGAIDVVLEIYDESVTKLVTELKGVWRTLEGKYDSYFFTVPSKRIGTGLYFIRPRLSSLDRVFYGHRNYNYIYFDQNDNKSSLLQLSICSFAYHEPKRLHGGVIYHIFVDRFNRGGKVKFPSYSNVIDGEWQSIPEFPEYPGAPLSNNTFYGGTLYGIIDKLDYIKSLGTTAIYLSPIFTSVSNHKYDTGDYMNVDPGFGGEKALLNLIDACKERDIELILDGVFNHTGSDSIYFNRNNRFKSLGAYQSKESPYFSWYDFRCHPNSYASWWGIDILPKINPDKEECANYFVGTNGVIEKYSKMGVYGFRLDVADELSDNFISRIKEKHTDIIPDSILYGEVWEDASNKCSYDKRRRYYLGRELDGVMNYPIRKGIIDFLLGKGIHNLEYALLDVTSNAPDRVLHNQMNLLGTHDTERILTILGDSSREGKSNHELSTLKMNREQRELAKKRLLCAYTFLATIPGIPTVFYGDEAGLEGYGDPFNRMPYPWGREDNQLIAHYRCLGSIRAENSVYKKGDFKLLYLDKELLIFKRCDNKYAYITVLNNSEREISIEFSSSALSLLENYKSDSHSLPPLVAGVYKVKNNSSIEIIEG